MKTFRYLIVAVLFLLVAGTSGAQTRKEKKEALKTYVGEQVNRRTFKLEASMAYPMSGRSIPLTTPYGLQMKKDSVDVYPPYYGRLSDTVWRRRGVAFQGSRRKLLQQAQERPLPDNVRGYDQRRQLQVLGRFVR